LLDRGLGWAQLPQPRSGLRQHISDYSPDPAI
jgi:hypothetical protein